MSTPSEPQAHGVHITAGSIDATVRIDGTPIPAGQLTGYVLEHVVGDSVPRLVLHTRQPDNVAFEGLARVAVGVPQETGDLVAEFLSQIDPAALEDAALNRDDLGSERYDLTRAMLRQAADWARGQQ